MRIKRPRLTQLILDRNDLVYNIEQLRDSADYHFSENNGDEAEALLIQVFELEDELRELDTKIDSLKTLLGATSCALDNLFAGTEESPVHINEIADLINKSDLNALNKAADVVDTLLKSLSN